MCNEDKKMIVFVSVYVCFGRYTGEGKGYIKFI